jgi:hypothetical protein
MDLLAARLAHSSPPDAVDGLSAFAGKAGACDLRSDGGRELARRRSYRDGGGCGALRQDEWRLTLVACGYYAARAHFRGAVTVVTAAHVKLPEVITNDHNYSVDELTRTPSFLTL